MGVVRVHQIATTITKKLTFSQLLSRRQFSGNQQMPSRKLVKARIIVVCEHSNYAINLNFNSKIVSFLSHSSIVRLVRRIYKLWNVIDMKDYAYNGEYG